MIGDNIILAERHRVPARKILQFIKENLSNRSVISIAGESGCGKSTLSIALKEEIEKLNLKVYVLHMDDYFHRAPTDTHNRRLENFDNVGKQEVNLELLHKHILLYKNEEKVISKPLIHFRENEIRSEILNIVDPSILIVEGTYVSTLADIDYKIFMTRNYIDSYEARMQRGRDQGTEFIEKVLSHEHTLISPDRLDADIIVDKEYSVSLNKINNEWWKKSIMYQIYPRSFQDSNDDGFGDIPGIISRLDHVKSLGTDIIWLSPVYPTPDKDYGYDISDYYGIDPRYGTLQDFDQLLDEVHHRDMKLIMDLVVNHSSDQHHFFQESRKSKDNPYRDYYIWRDNIDGNPPNNYQAWFGGSAWNYDAHTDAWYLALFTPYQPDFNWENPKVREEVYANMRYWLDKGVDGFRMDVISLLSKRPGLPASPSENITYLAEHYYANGPKIHEYLQEMNKEVLSKYDIVTVGEGPGITKKLALDYIGKDRKELNMIFQLDLMFGDHGEGGKFDIQPMSVVKMKSILDDWDAAVANGGWNNVFLDNHDFPRMVSRFGDDGVYRVRSAKMLITMLMSMRGTPCIYQGSEIGMTNVAFDNPQDYKDVEAVNYFALVDDKNLTLDDALKNMHIQGRDNVRTPMQWNDKAHGGFSKVDPWIRVNPNYIDINIEAAESDPDSILHYYRKVIALKKSNKTLVNGDYKSLTPNHESLYCILRNRKSDTLISVLNFSSESTSLPNHINLDDYELLISNVSNNDKDLIQPWEGSIYQLSANL